MTKSMKVSELISALQKMVEGDPALAEVEVATEGCDCDGDVGEVEVVRTLPERRNVACKPYIYLRRSR